MDRSSLLQLIQEQVRGEVGGAGTAPVAGPPPLGGPGGRSSETLSAAPSLHDLGPLHETEPD